MAIVYYILIGLSICVDIIVVLMYQSKSKKNEVITLNNIIDKESEEYVTLILNYFKRVEMDYYNDFLHNYLSVKFDIDELDEDYKYQVKNINSILALGVHSDKLSSGNKFLNKHSASFTKKEVNKTPDLALTFLISLSRNSGKLRALRFIETKYEAKQKFPEKYRQVKNELLGTRKELIIRF